MNLGDIDAVWLVYDTTAPGDNFMLFDNYRVTAEALPMISAQMELLGRTVEGWTLLRVYRARRLALGSGGDDQPA